MDGQLVALFANRAGRELTVLKRTPGGWTQSSEPISTGGPSIASLGQGVSTASEQIDVLVEHGNPVKRTVWSLDGADWIAGLPLEGLGDGPQVGGAVRTDGSLLIPVVDAARRVWPFSVYDYSGSGWAEVGGAPLNVGRGSAQGRLDLAGETAWAIWQEHRWRGGLFRTRIFTASFNGDEFRRPFEP